MTVWDAELQAKSIKTELMSVIPDKSLMQKIGKAGYSLGESLAELVDNSIDSFYHSYVLKKPLDDLTIRVDILPLSGYIQVEDNALGMEYREAVDCFRLGSSEKIDALGTYGIGLKGASMALGEQVVLLTGQAGNQNWYRMCLDEKQWLSQPDWKLPLELVSKKNPQLHGTIVRITKLRRARYRPAEIEHIVDDFSKRYSAFLKEKMISIYVNKMKCAYKQPELLDDRKNGFNVNITGGFISGWYGFLKRGSQVGQYGFDTFWHNRLITQYDKIGFTPHPTFARLVGAIHMDHVPVQTTKRGWQTDSPEYVEAIEELHKFLEAEGILRRARELSAQAKITKQVKDKVDEYLDSLANAMTSPDVLAMCPQDPVSPSSGPDGKEVSESGVREKSMMEVEKRNLKTEQGTSLPGDSTNTRTPTVTHKVERVVRIGGRRYRFEHDFRDLGEDQSYKEWILQNEKIVQVYTNTAFPAYDTTNDLAFYAVNSVAESLAEFIVGKKVEYESVNRLKDTILRKAGEIQSQI